MVDVRVRQEHGLDLGRGKRKSGVAFAGFLATPLIRTAVQKESLPVNHQLMHGAGDGLRGSPEGKFQLPAASARIA